ncbi:hydroxymethylbilane synthase [Cryobacterium tagatosivorans]|uniref:Porphobilinogen deaminase n=1 Tax=Cryobacterium tagatosivorans TaxID=1259199 RepID=A0A4R8UFE5_9MICO|nr:hydroxymethylbilane synthase [Cryobacterium tagatosivorans]TFB49915.1 hydroxymethylbilane synthase [Cryobacterium tagatosivorans]
MSAVIRVGTRGSALALAQTTAVANRIGALAGVPVEIIPITTHGDTSRESLSSLGGTGVFASALRESLLAGDCDLIVHSLKDLPTGAHPGLVIGATPKRADARDALCARDGLTLATLPEGARVGTGSPRRAAQLRSLRPDLEVVDIRGNVDTRLARVAQGDLDAVVLAAAGLGRLGRLDALAPELLELSAWPTAPGQGALAIEVRQDQADRRLAEALAAINHGGTQATTTAERLVLAHLEAGCAAPIGATAVVDDGLLFLTATVYSPDGTRKVTSSHAATPESHSARHLVEAAEDVAERAARELLAGGAADFAPLKVTS